MKMAFRHIQNDCVLCHANKVKDVRPLGECLHITANFWLYVRLLHLLPPLSPPPHLPDQQEQIYLTGYQHGSDSFAKQTFTSPQIALREINGDGGLDLPVTSSLSAPPAQVTPPPHLPVSGLSTQSASWSRNGSRGGSLCRCKGRRGGGVRPDEWRNNHN